MGSSEVNIGFNENAKVSSRVLKPPGGGHSNIFTSTESKSNPPRPKYNQQNSSNMNAVMGTVNPSDVGTDANKKSGGNNGNSTGSAFSSNSGSNNSSDSRNAPSDDQQSRVRVPPGGFSSGLW